MEGDQVMTHAATVVDQWLCDYEVSFETSRPRTFCGAVAKYDKMADVVL